MSSGRSRLRVNRDGDDNDPLSRKVSEFVNGESVSSFRDRLPDTLESKDVLRGVNGRSFRGRQMKQVYQQLVSDLGGVDNISFAESETARRCAALSIIAAEMETNLTLYNDEAFDLEQYLILARSQNRLFHSLGMKRKAKDVDKQSTSLDHYIKKKKA